jgi:hypothetical protein
MYIDRTTLVYLSKCFGMVLLGRTGPFAAFWAPEPKAL